MVDWRNDRLRTVHNWFIYLMVDWRNDHRRTVHNWFIYLMVDWRNDHRRTVHNWFIAWLTSVTVVVPLLEPGSAWRLTDCSTDWLPVRLPTRPWVCCTSHTVLVWWKKRDWMSSSLNEDEKRVGPTNLCPCLWKIPIELQMEERRGKFPGCFGRCFSIPYVSQRSALKRHIHRQDCAVNTVRCSCHSCRA